MAKVKVLKSVNIVLNLSLTEASFLRALCQNAILDDEDADTRECREGLFTVLNNALRDTSSHYINGPRN